MIGGELVAYLDAVSYNKNEGLSKKEAKYSVVKIRVGSSLEEGNKPNNNSGENESKYLNQHRKRRKKQKKKEA